MTKSKVKNKKPSTVWTKYDVSSGSVVRKQSCPRCGSEYFLALHKNRVYCGKCHYTEFSKK